MGTESNLHRSASKRGRARFGLRASAIAIGAALIVVPTAYMAPVKAQGLLGGLGEAVGDVADTVGGVTDGLGLGGTVDVSSGSSGSGIDVTIGGGPGKPVACSVTSAIRWVA